MSRTGKHQAASRASSGKLRPQIVDYAQQIAQRFDPDRIVLFGSHAYGDPGEESDVDLLVVMPTSNQIDQATRIRFALPAPFPLDLIVRTPRAIQKRLEEQDSFHSEITRRGTVLYEKSGSGVDRQGRRGPARRRSAHQQPAPAS